MRYCRPIAFAWPVPWAMLVYLYYSGVSCPSGVVYVANGIAVTVGGGEGDTNIVLLVPRATKFCTVGSSLCNLFYVALLASRILGWFLEF